MKSWSEVPDNHLLKAKNQTRPSTSHVTTRNPLILALEIINWRHYLFLLFTWRSLLSRVFQVWAFFPPTCFEVGSKALRQHSSTVTCLMCVTVYGVSLSPWLFVLSCTAPGYNFHIGWCWKEILILGVTFWHLGFYNKRMKKGTFASLMLTRSLLRVAVHAQSDVEPGWDPEAELKSPLLETLITFFATQIDQPQVVWSPRARQRTVFALCFTTSHNIISRRRQKDKTNWGSGQ